jgi:hypothetical protein
MRNPRKLAVFVAGTSALALLLSTSAFAETRHRDETSRGDQQRGDGRDGNQDGGDNGRQNRDWNRNNEHNRNNDNRGWDNRGHNNNDNRGSDNRGRNNNDNRGWDNRGRSENRDYRGNRGNREAYRNGIPRSDGRVTMLGRINRYERDRDGYRLWVGGSGYPYWVPESYFHGRRIGVGLDLRLGGIFRNGSVYVDVLGWPGDPYYNDPYYNDGYYGGGGGGYYGGYESGYVRGTVDAVDYRTATLYLRDDATRRLITVDMRRLERRNSRLDIDELRRGDRVTLSGSWFNGGIFAADRIDSFDAY